ncbi:MAG: DNA helicase Rep [Thiohalomonadales bacterium]|nr:DNA helicase Rep [Thiohalomonadales bacterium]
MQPQLNSPQLAAVRHLDGPCLVLAGAGSGKTRVITHKIAYLIQQCGIDPRHIAAVTFTNKAAREMKERVSNLLDKNAVQGLRVSTFHTLGLDVIRREMKSLDYKPGFSIYDNTDSSGLLRELMTRTFGDHGNQAEQMLWRISRWKNAFILPEQALAEANGDAVTVAAARLYEAYNHHLKTYNAVDFDDLIMLPVLLFREHPEILERWQNRIRYLPVDEYQDTNATQYELVQQLVGVRGNLTVVGDDDQSIYAWRGAQPENLAQLQQDFPRLKIIKLEQNYRSTGRILKAANRLIANNPHVFEKQLWSELGFGDPIRILRTRDEEQEAEQIVSELIHHRFVQRSRNSDYAILYRGNHQSRLFERVLREHDVPYYLSGGISFFAYAEVKDIMAYLRLLSNPDDDNAFLRIVNTPRREIGPGSVEKLANYATERGHSLFTASLELGLSQRLGPRPMSQLQQFAEWILDLRHHADNSETVSVARRLVTDIDYERWLLDNSRDEAQAMRRMDNVNELLSWLERMAKSNPEADLSELVAKLTLLDSLDRDEDERGDRVHLMTLHAAKGLEFPHVYLVGMEEELLPHRNSIEEENIEEERRLAYVGITRAQKNLTLSFASKRKRYGDVVDCQPSRFIDELPAEDLQWAGEGIEVNKEDRQQRGQAHLANLKSLLAES